MSLKSSMRLKQRRKAGDPWISTNRVLNGLGKKPGNFGRNPNFDTDETRLLIQLWGEPKIQRALITTHKKHAVIAQLAQKMQDYGYFRSPEEITTRIKNLKCFYNRIKKDEESGQDTPLSKPGWKHFSEMDAIMTRPIFSVRPNEIPAPSLKYRLEQAREERAERKKLKQTEGTLASDPLTDDSDDFIDDEDPLQLEDRDQLLDDGIIPDVEVDIDINDETFAAISKSQTTDPQNKKPKTDRDDELVIPEDAAIGEELMVKSEENNSSSSEKITVGKNAHKNDETNNTEKVISNAPFLLEPKQEPIDVDAEDNMEEVNEHKIDNPLNDENNKNDSSDYLQQLMPTLADRLQLSKDKNVSISSSTGGQVLIPVSSITTVAVNKLVTSSSSPTTTSTIDTRTTTPSSSAAAAAAATTTTLNNIQSMPGKISLVPTNFLMQPGKNIATRVVASTGVTTKTQPQPQQIHLLQSTPQLQQRILYSGGATSQAVTNSTNTGIMTTGPGGMKVLLLSAEQAAAAAAGNTTLTGVGNFSKTLGTFMPLNANMLMQSQMQTMQQQGQQQKTATATATKPLCSLQVQQQQQKVLSSSSSSTSSANTVSPKQNVFHKSVTDDKVHPTRTSARKKLHQKQQFQKQQLEQEQEHQRQQRQQQHEQQQSEPLTRKDATNLRILLRQLLNAQFENNAINSRRWKLERDRFEFEKTLSERFFDAIPTFVDSLKEAFKPMQQQQQQQQQPMQTAHQQQQQQQMATHSAQQIFKATPFMTVTSAGSSGGQHLRLQPPKLLFTAVRHPTLYNATQNTISLASPSLTPLITTKTHATYAAPNNDVPSAQSTTIPDNENHQLIIPKTEPQDN